MGLVVFIVMGLYLLISIGIVSWAISYASKNGKRVKRWGWSAVLVMYLIPFWDWVPTVATHRYYCAKDSGFWVYKTLDQWKEENPGVMETLVTKEGDPSSRQGGMENYTNTNYLNQRFNWVVKHHGKFLFNRWRHEQEVVDTKTNAVLARYVDFSTSQERQQAGWSGWKFWLANRHCMGGDYNQGMMYSFEHNVRGAEK